MTTERFYFVDCERCDGSGFTPLDVCAYCHGNGIVPVDPPIASASSPFPRVEATPAPEVPARASGATSPRRSA